MFKKKIYSNLFFLFRNKTIPHKWQNYCSIGSIVRGSFFIPFKVPLDKSVTLSNEKRFTIPDLLRLCPKLGLVINLTYTTRYYNPHQLQSKSIKYKAIPCRGHGEIPSEFNVKDFHQTVDTFLKESPNSLIGVHCTHGINRTGYMICRYLIEELGFEPRTAIETFQEARGHHFERQIYIQNLLSLNNFNLRYFEARPSRNYNQISYSYFSKVDRNTNWRK